MTKDDSTEPTWRDLAPDRIFETAGGFEYIDQLAEGFYERARESTTGAGLYSSREVFWLVEGYARLRAMLEEVQTLADQSRRWAAKGAHASVAYNARKIYEISARADYCPTHNPARSDAP